VVEDGGEKFARSRGEGREGVLLEVVAQRGELDGGSHAVAADVIVGVGFLEM
jgi:hypothetical protein